VTPQSARAEHAAAPGASAPLWRLLQGAAQTVQAVRAGHSATALLGQVDARLRPGVQALSFQALRYLGRAQALRQRLAQRPPPPPADALLCTALALCWTDEHAPYEPFTLVDQAVEAAKHGGATRGQAGFINGCLRRFLRERAALVAATDPDPVARWNHPQWWIDQLRSDHPQHWEAILRASNSPPPMTLRVNARRSTPAQYLAVLRDAGIEATAIGEHGVLLAHPRPVHEVPGFEAGVVSVQDAAAQLAAPLLLRGLAAAGGGGAALRILDACAAPGGKTAHLLELANAQVIALDIAPDRCERIGQTLARLGLQAQVIAGDALQPSSWWDGVPFDAILLDAPCTASGIVRRHPDVRWLRRPGDVEQLAAVQARLLAVLWPLVRPGGRLVYCTCSVFRAEGQTQAQTFVAHNKDAFSRPATGHLMPQTGVKADGVQDNLEGDHDGFFYALFEKQSGRPAEQDV
jgi:16S rRNA (cytosine967-C5)-methyltransferase